MTAEHVSGSERPKPPDLSVSLSQQLLSVKGLFFPKVTKMTFNEIEEKLSITYKSIPSEKPPEAQENGLRAKLRSLLKRDNCVILQVSSEGKELHVKVHLNGLKKLNMTPEDQKALKEIAKNKGDATGIVEKYLHKKIGENKYIQYLNTDMDFSESSRAIGKQLRNEAAMYGHPSAKYDLAMEYLETSSELLKGNDLKGAGEELKKAESMISDISNPKIKEAAYRELNKQKGPYFLASGNQITGKTEKELKAKLNFYLQADRAGNPDAKLALFNFYMDAEKEDLRQRNTSNVSQNKAMAYFDIKDINTALQEGKMDKRLLLDIADKYQVHSPAIFQHRLNLAKEYSKAGEAGKAEQELRKMDAMIDQTPGIELQDRRNLAKEFAKLGHTGKAEVDLRELEASLGKVSAQEQKTALLGIFADRLELAQQYAKEGSSEKLKLAITRLENMIGRLPEEEQKNAQIAINNLK